MLRNLQTSIQSLNNQVGQLARVSAEWPQGSLPSNTEQNMREHLKDVTLRSGGQVEIKAEDGSCAKKDGVTTQEDPQAVEPVVVGSEKEQNKETPKLPTSKVPEYKPPIPNLARLKWEKDGAQLKKFLNMFKQLHINITLFKALAGMPKYTKFMKDLTNKKKLEELETIALPKNC